MADVTLPQLGETVTEGTITQWFKSVGDTVSADEPLFEVSTDKVDTEVPSPVTGVLSEIRVAEGETVEVGAIVAVVGDGAAAPAPAPAAEPAPAQRLLGFGACSGACSGSRACFRAGACSGSRACFRAGACSEPCPGGADSGSARQPVALASREATRQRERSRRRCDHWHRPRRAHHPRGRARSPR